MAKKVVISLHGIRTRGVWQKKLSPFISERGWKYYPLDYGYFMASKLLVPAFQDQKVGWLRDEYNKISGENGGQLPSVIVHSFGSLILAKMLEKCTDIHWDKIILTGSIIPTSFNWEEVINKQCSAVLNLVAGRDWLPSVARWSVRGAGNSGRVGFPKKNPEDPEDPVRQVFYRNFTHSDALAADVFVHQMMVFLEELLPSDEGTTEGDYLQQVSPYDAGIWMAVTYKKQYLGRVDVAFANDLFFEPHKDGTYTKVKVKKLIMVMPSTTAGAAEPERKKFRDGLGLKTILIGDAKDRSAWLAADGTAYDIPSGANSFEAYDSEYFHNDKKAAANALKSFDTCLRALVDKMVPDNKNPRLEVKTLAEVLPPAGP